MSFFSLYTGFHLPLPFGGSFFWSVASCGPVSVAGCVTSGRSRSEMAFLGSKKAAALTGRGFWSDGRCWCCPSPSGPRDGEVMVSRAVTTAPKILRVSGGALRSGFSVRSGRGLAFIGSQPYLVGREFREVEVPVDGLRSGVSQTPQKGTSSQVQDRQFATTANPQRTP